MTVSIEYDVIYDRLEFVPNALPRLYERMPRELVEGLDPAIRFPVCLLNAHGIVTCQSCQGGPDHAYPEPTVDVYTNGDPTNAAWLTAIACLSTYGLPLVEVRHKWRVVGGVPIEPVWQFVFHDSIRDGVADPVAHGSPLPGSDACSCCGIAPWDIPPHERMTNDVSYVTCRGAGR